MSLTMGEIPGILKNAFSRRDFCVLASQVSIVTNMKKQITIRVVWLTNKSDAAMSSFVGSGRGMVRDLNTVPILGTIKKASQ